MAETEFLKITEAKQALKGAFIGTVIKASDLKSGTKDGRDWTKKVFVVQDDSADVELVTWGDEIKLFAVGQKYEFVNPWWKTYEGKVSVSIGKYGSAKVIGSANTEEPIPRSTIQQQIAPSNSPKADGTKCPHGKPTLEDYVCKKCLVSYYEGLVKEMRQNIGE